MTSEQQLLNSPHLVIAVDPGKSGAVCRMGQGKFSICRDFKELPDIASAITDCSPGATHAVMELVHAMPGQGVCSMFSFGRASGVADGAFAVALPKLAVEYVSPQKWQNFFRNRLGVGKDMEFDSREIASRVCRWSAPYLKRKKDHNSADAILIAAWKLFQLAESSGEQTRRYV